MNTRGAASGRKNETAARGLPFLYGLPRLAARREADHCSTGGSVKLEPALLAR